MGGDDELPTPILERMGGVLRAGARVNGPFDEWWYGEWVVTTESGGPFDLRVVANARP